MGLFDVIRYPISNPPTVAEFEALPQKLFRTWTTRCALHEKPVVLALWYAETWNATTKRYTAAGDKEDLEILRKIIRNWEE